MFNGGDHTADYRKAAAGLLNGRCRLAENRDWRPRNEATISFRRDIRYVDGAETKALTLNRIATTPE
jgi:hypothetical protein